MRHIDDLMGRLGNKMFILSYMYSQMRHGIIPDIYVQSPKYFEHCKDDIRRLYGTPNEIADIIGIHVRRGDYVDNPFYVDLFENGYYDRAKAEFPNERFLIISDDIKWCKKKFPKDLFAESSDEYADFELLSKCKGIIIANSSYSWWAAYLSNAKKIVAPSVENWYTDGVARTECPAEWIRI